MIYSSSLDVNEEIVHIKVPSNISVTLSQYSPQIFSAVRLRTKLTQLGDDDLTPKTWTHIIFHRLDWCLLLATTGHGTHLDFLGGTVT